MRTGQKLVLTKTTLEVTFSFFPPLDVLRRLSFSVSAFDGWLLPLIVQCLVDIERARGRLLLAAYLTIGVLERNHIVAGYSNPLGGHGWSAACHMPGSVGLPKGTF